MSIVTEKELYESTLLFSRKKHDKHFSFFPPTADRFFIFFVYIFFQSALHPISEPVVPCTGRKKTCQML